MTAKQLDLYKEVEDYLSAISPSKITGDMEAVSYMLSPSLIYQEKPKIRRGIPWSTAEFYGDDFTSSESTSLNRSLKKLEQRGLIERGYHKGKGQRTSHIKLTHDGIKSVRWGLELEG